MSVQLGVMTAQLLESSLSPGVTGWQRGSSASPTHSAAPLSFTCLACHTRLTGIPISQADCEHNMRKHVSVRNRATTQEKGIETMKMEEGGGRRGRREEGGGERKGEGGEPMFHGTKVY